ncbi:hypothetical protein BKA67DRAFT_575142 [Truncatella angustata]|uniref:Uncharacterized protein n=1 Tax=Truncatella angustata TaxID=152316 RepID=A0A9P8UEM6_9PEZI|nr:uncharacterized protein BKA67DRAFT_575142 [Truncatella angustata]KAH6648541.1 hypothetical protein BKA67DRAFT_575142 [Truncatella angustata]KAH8198457.1 hypothetical protein TruAng_007389 [Truncatella angustata]
MHISREPSQRTKAWVKWNYGQKHTSKASLDSAPSEIIHLGGSRVGTPEPSPSRPGTAQDFDRPCTTWFASPYAPPPEPPVGIARSKTDPQELLSPSGSHSSYEILDHQLSPAPLSIPSGKLASPLLSATSTSSFSKLSSPPPYSSGSVVSTSSDVSRQLRRTQSAADIQKRARVRSKALPPKPTESHDDSESDTQESSRASHVGQMIKEDAQETPPQRVTRWFPLPPLTSPPPTKPLPAIRATSPTNSEGSDKSPKLATAKQQSPRTTTADQHSPKLVAANQQSPEAATTTDQHSPKATAASQQQTHKAKALPQRPTSRLSPQERLWLHRNYRGEATFLKAWGLSIEKAEDREEGITMMRELMDAEDEKKKAKKAQKAKDLGLPDGGLQIIIEEEKGSLSEPDKPSPRMTSCPPSSKPQGLRVPGRGGNPSPTDRHLRSESESSVLGAYLDIRMSRLD